MEKYLLLLFSITSQFLSFFPLDSFRFIILLSDSEYDLFWEYFVSLQNCQRFLFLLRVNNTLTFVHCVMFFGQYSHLPPPPTLENRRCPYTYVCLSTTPAKFVANFRFTPSCLVQKTLCIIIFFKCRIYNTFRKTCKAFFMWDVSQQVAINRFLPVICSYQKDACRNKNRGKSCKRKSKKDKSTSTHIKTSHLYMEQRKDCMKLLY